MPHAGQRIVGRSITCGKLVDLDKQSDRKRLHDYRIGQYKFLPPAPTYSGVEGNVMHVVSTIGHAGIAQNPLPERKKVLVTCWVYVVRGKVGIGAGNAGNTSTTSISQSICKWEKLSGINSVSPANNVCIYAQYALAEADGAEFYVDNVMVEEM